MTSPQRAHLLRESILTPWKLRNELARWIVLPLNRARFGLAGVKWGRGWRIYGRPVLERHRRSTIRFGDDLQLRCWLSANPLGANHRVIICTWESGAELTVGSGFGMTGGSIVAASRVTIGNNVNVGANTSIIDTDFHPLGPAARRLEPQGGRSAPVTIESDVFIGMNCLILKGVTVGGGSVVGAGSVVSKDVPQGSIVAGNPARVIGKVADGQDTSGHGDTPRITPL